MFNKDTCTSAGSGSYRGTADRHGMSLSALSVGVCVVVGRWSAVLTLRRTLEGGDHLVVVVTMGGRTGMGGGGVSVQQGISFPSFEWTNESEEREKGRAHALVSWLGLVAGCQAVQWTGIGLDWTGMGSWQVAGNLRQGNRCW